MANKYEKMFVPGALKCPDKLIKRQAFCAGAKLVLPTAYVVEGALTQIENQGQLPYCAAYSTTTFGESVLWRKNGYSEQINPTMIYKYAKTIDGDPNGDGTSLTAAMSGLLKYGYFDANICKVRTFGGVFYGVDADTAVENVKAAIFKFGACVIGCSIETSWYTPKNGVIRGGGSSLGGHAITACGYDCDGIIIRNSWGADWGHNGDAYLPNDVFEKQFMYGACLSNALNDFS